MKNARLLIIVSALVLLAAACGGQSAEEELLEQILENSGEDIGDVDINLDDGGNGEFSINVEGENGGDVSISGSGDDEEMTITVEGDDGGTMTIGGGDIPDELELPVAPGGAVQTSMTSGDEVFVSLQYPDGDYDQIIAFYDAELNSDSDEVTKSETSFTSEDGTFRNTFYAPENGSDWTVMVGDCIGLEGVCVTLGQSGS